MNPKTIRLAASGSALVAMGACMVLDPDVVAVVDDETRFFRSSDGGVSWPAP